MAEKKTRSEKPATQKIENEELVVSTYSEEGMAPRTLVHAEPPQATTLRNAGNAVYLCYEGDLSKGYGDVYYVQWSRAAQAGITYVRSDQNNVWDALVISLT
jgi:hypothetical protein